MEEEKIKLKSVKPRVFKFEKGQNWDGDEEIFGYIEDLLLEETEAGNFPEVKQKTYITIMCAKEVKQEARHPSQA